MDLFNIHYTVPPLSGRFDMDKEANRMLVYHTRVITLRRTHQMCTIAINDTGVCLSVCQSVTRAGCVKTAERIDVLFGVETPGDRRNIVLDGVSIPMARGFDAAFAKLLWLLVISFTLNDDIVDQQLLAE